MNTKNTNSSTITSGMVPSRLALSVPQVRCGLVRRPRRPSSTNHHRGMLTASRLSGASSAFARPASRLARTSTNTQAPRAMQANRQPFFNCQVGAGRPKTLGSE